MDEECKHCHKPITRFGNGPWWHVHTALVYCDAPVDRPAAPEEES